MGDSACARPVEGLFLPSDCTRMALAVKQETDKSNLVNVLDGSGPFAKACSQPRGKGLSNRSMSPVIANSLSPIPPTVLSPLIPAPQRLTSARRFEMSRGRSLPGTSLAAETKLVFGTAPSRSRLCISTLRFRAARVSKRILFRLKTARFLESLEHQSCGLQIDRAGGFRLDVIASGSRQGPPQPTSGP